MKSTTIDFMSSSVSYSLVLLGASIIIFLFPIAGSLEPQLQTAAASTVSGTLTAYAKAPTSVAIPSVGLKAPVVAVGVNSKGEMDVPDGQTNEVGWYGGGTVPGNIGSAVLDAHVFAAFSKLNKVKVGSDIYVTEGTHTLHFVVSQVQTYALSALSPQTLFARADARRLNLITCAGTYVPSIGTYDHRLVVYATLAA